MTNGFFFIGWYIINFTDSLRLLTSTYPDGGLSPVSGCSNLYIVNTVSIPVSLKRNRSACLFSGKP